MTPPNQNSGSAFGVPEDMDWAFGDAADDTTALPTTPAGLPQPPSAPYGSSQPPLPSPPAPPAPQGGAGPLPTRTPVAKPVPAQQPRLPQRGPSTPAAPPPPTAHSPIQQQPAPTYSPQTPAPTYPPVVDSPYEQPPTPQPVYEPEPTTIPERPTPASGPAVRGEEVEDWITSEPAQWSEHTWGTTSAQKVDGVDDYSITISDSDFDEEDEAEQTQANLLDDIASGLNPKKGGRTKPTKTRETEAQKEQKEQKKSLFGFSPKSSSPKGSKVKVKMGNAPIGLRIFRVVLISFMVFAMLLGFRYMIAPPPQASVAAVADAVSEKIGVTAFPADAAGSLASQYASVYLTYLPDQQDSRKATLNSLAPTLGTDQYGGSFASFQYVTSGPFVVNMESPNDTTATVTVAATVSPSRDEVGTWTYLSLPMTADEYGRITISGPPAFLPAPTGPDTVAVTRSFDDDEEAAKALGTLLPEYLSAWAASDNSALSQYVSPQATDAALTGLAGTVTLSQLSSLTIPTTESQPEITPTQTGLPTGTVARQAWFGVEWTDTVGNSFNQAYYVILWEDTNTQKFLIQDIQGGVSLQTAVEPTPQESAQTDGA